MREKAGIAVMLVGAVALLVIAWSVASGGEEERGPPSVASPSEPTRGPAPIASAQTTQPSADQPVSATPALAGGATPAPSGPTPGVQAQPPDRRLVLAPIDGADVLILESFPPQYRLHVLAGLPNGCAKQAGYETSRLGSTIRVLVYNSLPTGDVVCTMIYGAYELNIDLGRLDSGTTYAIEVNDRRLTLKTQ